MGTDAPPHPGAPPTARKRRGGRRRRPRRDRKVAIVAPIGEYLPPPPPRIPPHRLPQTNLLEQGVHLRAHQRRALSALAQERDEQRSHGTATTE